MADQHGRPMQYPLTADLSGVLAIAHREQPVSVQRSRALVGASLPTRVWRATIEAWVRHVARRVAIRTGAERAVAMPIRRDLRSLDPPHWRELSGRIQFERAGAAADLPAGPRHRSAVPTGQADVG